MGQAAARSCRSRCPPPAGRPGGPDGPGSRRAPAPQQGQAEKKEGRGGPCEAWYPFPRGELYAERVGYGCSWARISPPLFAALCTLTYVLPALKSSMSEALSFAPSGTL